MLVEMCAEWEIPDGCRKYIVTDNGRNIRAAVRRLPWTERACFAHTLQLAIYDEISNTPSIDRLCKKARHIMGHYKHSSSAQKRLDEYQKKMGKDPLRLVQDVDTRWNSQYLMLSRLLGLKEAVSVELATSNCSIDGLCSAEWKEALEYLDTLKPLYDATVITSADKYPSLSTQIPIIFGMLSCLSNFSGTTGFHKELENVDPSDLQDKVLDFDEDERYPQYIPKKGAFYQHDDRVVGDEDSSEVPEKKTDYDKGSRRPKKLWHEECVWEHDMYREEEQGPKSSEELVRIYGYDIRLELMPPRARRWRRYGRGPNKYERSWENKEAYTLRSRSGRGGGARGGRRTRGVSLVENPQFHNEDFPDLHSKPSENTAAMQLNRAEVKSSAKPAGFKGSDLTGSNSSQQEKWDNTVKGSGTTHWGWRKRPSLPPRAVPDASPKQQDYDVKEDVPLGHRVDRPAPQSPVMAVEVPQVSPTACRSRAIQHLLRKNDQSKREYEALKELAAKGELQGGKTKIFIHLRSACEIRFHEFFMGLGIPAKICISVF
ncbi:hypothetical protein MRX96_005284 [Rhipicephalus microplus]